MKPIKILLLACALCLAPNLLTGCASGPLNIFKSNKVAYIGVDTAMNLWGDHVRSVKAGVDTGAKDKLASQEPDVKKAYEAYQQAAVATIDAAMFLQAHPDATVSMDTAVALFSATKADLMVLISKFAPNLKLTL